jgi:signal transduction histidine kinase
MEDEVRFSWKSLSLQSKFLLGLAAAAATGCLLFGWAFYYHMKSNLEIEVASKGSLVLSQVSAVQMYVRETLRPEMYDTLGNEQFVIEAMSTSYVSRKVMENISSEVRDFGYRRVALNARNPKFEPAGYELELLEYFRQNPHKIIWKGMRGFEGEEFHVTAKPVRFSKSCMRCHGSPEDAPKELLERYGDERGFGHTEGEIAGVTWVRIPIQGALNRIRETATGFLMLAGLVGVFCFALTNVLFNRLVVHNLRGLADVFPRYFKDAEPGMLDRLRRGDEIDEIFRAVEEMASHLSVARSELEDYAQNLERMVEERTKDLARAAEDHGSDVRLFVDLLSEMNRSQTRRMLMQAALPLIVKRFGLKEAAFVCTQASNNYFSWPSGGRPEIPESVLKIGPDPEPIFEGDRAFVPVQSSESLVEGLLCLYWPHGSEPPSRRSEVIVALSRQLGIAMENLSFMDRLLRQNDLLESLVEGISDPLFLTDGACNLLLANRAARELFEDRSPADEGSRCIERLLGGVRESSDDNPMHKILVEGLPCSYEVRLSEERYYRVNVYPLPEGEEREKRNRRFVVYARDYSSEKRMLRNIQQNEKMVTVGKLAAGLAHEMNNPLGVILCYAELLQASAESDQQKQDVEIIIQHTRKAQKVLQDLLNFARSKKALSDGVCAPAQVLKSLTEMFEVQAESRNITLESEIDDPLPQVKVDAASLEQVFSNLLINAMDAVEPGVGRIRISALADNGVVVVRISDNGPGITAENMVNIFEPFYTTKKVGKGTGLGLAVVYGIVQEIGGSINVENGDGATFTLTLPAASQERETAENG